jgi:FAD-dependent urate hydroxylase
MDVLVAGAGIGGLAVAAGLLADGHGVRVLEAADRLRRGGAAVTINANGQAAMAGLGVRGGHLGGRIDALEFRAGDGARLLRADLRIMPRKTGFAVATVPRERLVDHLAAALPADVVRFGAGVRSVEVRSDGVEVVDAVGRTHRAELLVGADGHASAVRRATVSPEPAADAGWTTWQGLSPVLPELAKGALGLCLVGDAGLVGLMPAGDGLLQWWFDVRDLHPQPGPGEVLDRLAGLFGRYAAPVPELLAAVDERDVAAYPHVVHQVPERWGTGPTTLVGDAAHAFPPSQAQGANQTLEDAWLLVRAVRLSGPVPAQLRRYEARRIPRVRRVSRLSASELTNRTPGRATRAAARAVPSAVAGRLYLAQIRRWSSVLHDERS